MANPRMDTTDPIWQSFNERLIQFFVQCNFNAHKATHPSC